MTQQNPNALAPGDDPAARLAALHAECRADYQAAEANRATNAGAARDQSAFARMHAADGGGHR
ncbi:hypothetical protein [Streptomyces sp. SLBN-134]|uniref:hypothetical protein n=1 Tax=Streptomyces sp. SLBN-134 TaxID=2768456 RepID=UPI0011517823|nr:hypothetical protein [Streptomyces sp. SLBN-134]TQL21949.1 hypothetical protein FBY37_3966 [Streptomyces sp. SLBN-134]